MCNKARRKNAYHAAAAAQFLAEHAFRVLHLLGRALEGEELLGLGAGISPVKLTVGPRLLVDLFDCFAAFREQSGFALET